MRKLFWIVDTTNTTLLASTRSSSIVLCRILHVFHASHIFGMEEPAVVVVVVVVILLLQESRQLNNMRFLGRPWNDAHAQLESPTQYYFGDRAFVFGGQLEYNRVGQDRVFVLGCVTVLCAQCAGHHHDPKSSSRRNRRCE